MKYDSAYPTFRLARQASKPNSAASCAEIILRRCPICGRDLIIGHGHRRKQAHDAHHRLDRDSARSLPWLREDLHLPPAAFSPLHALQSADAWSGIAAALLRSIVPGRRRRLRSKIPIACPMLPRFVAGPADWTSSQAAFSFLRQTLTDIAHWLVPRYIRPISTDWAFVLAEFGSPDSLAPAALRKFLHHPCLEKLAAFAYLRLQKQKAPWAKILKNSNSAFRCLIICGSRTGSRDLQVMVPSSSASVPCIGRPVPSFYVNAPKNLFYCHGCGQGGDLLRFIPVCLASCLFRQSLTYLQQHEGCFSRSCGCARANRHLLSTATRWATQRHCAYLKQRRLHQDLGPDQRTAHRLCPWWELAPASHRSRLLLSSSCSVSVCSIRRGHDAFYRRVVFPCCQGGRVINLYGRSIAAAFAHRFLPGSKGGFYWLDQV